MSWYIVNAIIYLENVPIYILCLEMGMLDRVEVSDVHAIMKTWIKEDNSPPYKTGIKDRYCYQRHLCIYCYGSKWLNPFSFDCLSKRKIKIIFKQITIQKPRYGNKGQINLVLVWIFLETRSHRKYN